ncbi:hypothetical protein PLEOSDRAFT_154615 [Pleurotus ostreatus PC15]|nr:hypothetical protein PLEOSDRAFT_154615 [Pleurotus ostreatus PC15]
MFRRGSPPPCLSSIFKTVDCAHQRSSVAWTTLYGRDGAERGQGRRRWCWPSFVGIYGLNPQWDSLATGVPCPVSTLVSHCRGVVIGVARRVSPSPPSLGHPPPLPPFYPTHTVYVPLVDSQIPSTSLVPLPPPCTHIHILAPAAPVRASKLMVHHGALRRACSPESLEFGMGGGARRNARTEGGSGWAREKGQATTSKPIDLYVPRPPPLSSNLFPHPITTHAYPSPQIITTQRKCYRLKGKPEKTRKTTRAATLREGSRCLGFPTQPPYITADGLDGLWANVARIFIWERVSERGREDWEANERENENERQKPRGNRPPAPVDSSTDEGTTRGDWQSRNGE